MIELEILEAPNDFYLGNRKLLFDEFTFGINAKVPVKSKDCLFPIFKFKIKKNDLVIQPAKDYIYFVNHKKFVTRTIVTYKPVEIKIDNFHMKILNFQKEPKYKKFDDIMKEKIKKNQSNKDFMKLLKTLQS